MLTNTYIISLKFNTKLNFVNFDLKRVEHGYTAFIITGIPWWRSKINTYKQKKSNLIEITKSI